MIALLDYSLKEIKDQFKAKGQPAFRAQQVFDWINKGVVDFAKMHNLGAATRDFLKATYRLDVPELVTIQTSADGTRKGLAKLHDGHLIECVLMKYDYGYSVCISTQVGCAMGCSFCASTRGGKVRNLSPGEMLGQIIALQKLAGDRIGRVVLMGSGEPLDNFDNVAKFLDLVTAPEGLNIGQRHITLSTCGIAPGIRKFADLNNQVTLAISLHQVTDEARGQLMPIAKQYKLKELFDALRYYQAKTGRRISFEYALVSQVNDSLDHARELKKLLAGLMSHVNLIPLNEIKDGFLKKPDGTRITAFLKELERLGVPVSLRREMGSDIDAACGQLKRSFQE